MKRSVAIGCVLSFAIVGLGAVESPAQADACGTTNGVTVIVDSTSLPGGSATSSCAPGSPSSGLAALTSAGYSIAMVATQPGFVCRIGGLPSDQKCVNTPPVDGYWAYFRASRGGSWTYSNLGAATKPAVVEGWAFQTSRKLRLPAVAVPAAFPKDASPSTPSKTPTKPSNTGTSTGSGSPSATGGTSTGSSTTSPSGSSGSSAGNGGASAQGSTPSPSDPSTTSSGTTSPSTSADGTPVVAAPSIDAQAVAATQSSTDSPKRSSLMLWLGLAVVALLLIATVVVEIRRRQQS